jgi:hypothetical protein
MPIGGSFAVSDLESAVQKTDAPADLRAAGEICAWLMTPASGVDVWTIGGSPWT